MQWPVVAKDTYIQQQYSIGRQTCVIVHLIHCCSCSYSSSIRAWACTQVESMIARRQPKIQWLMPLIKHVKVAYPQHCVKPLLTYSRDGTDGQPVFLILPCQDVFLILCGKASVVHYLQDITWYHFPIFLSCCESQPGVLSAVSLALYCCLYGYYYVSWPIMYLLQNMPSREQSNLSYKIWAVLIEGIFVLNFLFFCFRAICFFSWLSFFFCPNIGMLSVPGIFPSVKFPMLGNITCFYWEKEEGNLGKNVLDKKLNTGMFKRSRIFFLS